MTCLDRDHIAKPFSRKGTTHSLQDGNILEAIHTFPDNSKFKKLLYERLIQTGM